MPRYNTSLDSNTITGTTTISSPKEGAFTQLTGISGYTVTLPSPSAFPGRNFTFYNATSPAGVVTISTPNGIFNGTGGPNTSTYNISAGNVISVTSDGSNYIVISEDGSPLTATTGAFTGNVEMTGGLSVTGSGTLSLNPASTGAINNVNIGASTRGTAAFTSLSATAAVTLTANTASSSTTTGTLVVTGGIGASGTVNAATVTATTLTGTLSTAAQPNITSATSLTSVGTLAGVGIAGDITFSNSLTARFIKGSANGGAIRIRADGDSSTDRGVQIGNVNNLGTFTNCLSVDNGNVGVNTTTPQVALQVKANNGASGTLSLSGSSANDTGGASYILMGNTDSAGTTGPSVILSANRTLQLGVGTSFSSASGGTFTSHMSVNSNSSVVIGNTTSQISSGKLSIYAGGAAGVGWGTGLNIGDGSSYTGFIQDAGVSRWRNFGSGGYDWYNSGGGTQLMILSNSGNLSISGTLTESSSITLKENVEPIIGALDLVNKLMGKIYDRRDNGTKQESGLIAEEVFITAPNLVALDDNGKPVGVKYTKIIAYLIESIKELSDEVTKLKGK
jgi:hypothetical protein